MLVKEILFFNSPVSQNSYSTIAWKIITYSIGVVILRIMHLLKGFEFLFSLDGMQCKATEQERKGF